MTTVTGYKLRASLKSLDLKLAAAVRVFTDSLVKFPSEKKSTPQEAMSELQALEVKAAKIQAAQAVYNTLVKVDVLGNSMTLAEAVKRVGGAGRIVALWKKASGAVAADHYRRYEEPIYANMKTRESDKEYAERTVSDMDATLLAVEAERFASALRGAIAEGNGTSVDMDLDPTLLAE